MGVSMTCNVIAIPRAGAEINNRFTSPANQSRNEAFLDVVAAY